MVVGTEVYHTLGNREVMVLNHVGCWANSVSPLSKMCPFKSIRDSLFINGCLVVQLVAKRCNELRLLKMLPLCL